MTPTLNKSCSDTQAPDYRLACSAFGQIVLQYNHQFICNSFVSLQQIWTRGLMILTVGEGPTGYGLVWHMEKCLLGCGCVWVAGCCMGPPFAWVGGTCALCSQAGCVGCLPGRERHSATSGCMFFLVWWVFSVPTICPCLCAWFWFCRQLQLAIFHVFKLSLITHRLEYRPEFQASLLFLCSVCFSGHNYIVLHLFYS